MVVLYLWLTNKQCSSRHRQDTDPYQENLCRHRLYR